MQSVGLRFSAFSGISIGHVNRLVSNQKWVKVTNDTSGARSWKPYKNSIICVLSIPARNNLETVGFRNKRNQNAWVTIQRREVMLWHPNPYLPTFHILLPFHSELLLYGLLPHTVSTVPLSVYLEYSSTSFMYLVAMALPGTVQYASVLPYQ